MAKNTRLKELAVDIRKLQDVMASQETRGSKRISRLEQQLDAFTKSHDPNRIDHLESSMDTLTRSMDAISCHLE